MVHVIRMHALAGCIALLGALACGDGEQARQTADLPCASEDASCAPRDVSEIDVISGGVAQGAASGPYPDAPSVEGVLEKGPLESGQAPVHIAIRGIAQPESVRCDWHGIARTLGYRENEIRFWLAIDEDEALPSPTEVERRLMTHVNGMRADHRPEWTAWASALANGGVSSEYNRLKCYADYAIQNYVLGNGPRALTVAYDRQERGPSYGLYSRAHAAGAYRGADKLAESEFATALAETAYEAAEELKQAVGSRQSVVFLTPMGAFGPVAVEAWQAVDQWDLQRADDGTVNAVRYGVPQDDPEYSLPYADLKRRVATAAGSDAFAGKRIANASGITQYYRDIGAYGDITPGDGETTTFTPAQPPPRCGSAVANHAANPGLVQDCMALLAAKDELRGTRSLNWSESLAIADWDGVKTTGTPARVTQVRLVARRFTGTIPSSLGKLPALTRLFLNGNELTGTIPPSLGDLAALEQLRLNDNDLTGSLPAELGELANLRELWISDNALTGAIPSELGSLSKLEVLSLLNNDLTGSIPSELGSLSKLTQLSLSNNALTGSIPTELTNLPSLAWLRLGGNALTGCIPSSLRSVADHDLHRLRALAAC